jgi:anti-anti-sigma regulatory factor
VVPVLDPPPAAPAAVAEAAAVPAAPGPAPLEAAPAVAPASAEAAPAVVEAPAAGTPANALIQSGIEIKDVEAVHKRLAAALDQAEPMQIDLSQIGSIDTAGVQLLLALRADAAARGVALEFAGESAALTQALALLGLRDSLRIGAS